MIVKYGSYQHSQNEVSLRITREPMRSQDGKPIRRPPKGIVSVPPCRQKENGCPKGRPENPKSLTRQNQKAYAYYLQCKATGQFPDDSIVKYHAGLIREVEEYIEEARNERLEKLLEAVLTRTI